NGGRAKFNIASSLTLADDFYLNGGDSGANEAVAGKGGNSTGVKTGGAGGSVGIQGDGGKGGNIDFTGGSLIVQGKPFTVNGGNALINRATAGDGGTGGGAGGDGGAVGSAGGGGNGGIVNILVSQTAQIDG